MDYNFDDLKTELADKKAVPLVVLFGTVAEGGGVDLDFLTTSIYDKADPVLQQDVTKAIGMIHDQMSGGSK